MDYPCYIKVATPTQVRRGEPSHLGSIRMVRPYPCRPSGAPGLRCPPRRMLYPRSRLHAQCSISGHHFYCVTIFPLSHLMTLLSYSNLGFFFANLGSHVISASGDATRQSTDRMRSRHITCGDLSHGTGPQTAVYV